MKHLKYLSYVLRHKWHVGVQCFHQGLLRRAFTHDMSKFLPSEWFPYVESFYGDRAKAKPAFTRAWLKHLHRNDHHNQHWVLRNDDGTDKVLEMPHDCVVEMLCDWYGAGAAQGHDGGWKEVRSWYEKNKAKMNLGPKTKEFVESFLELWGT